MDRHNELLRSNGSPWLISSVTAVYQPCNFASKRTSAMYSATTILSGSYTALLESGSAGGLKNLKCIY